MTFEVKIRLPLTLWQIGYFSIIKTFKQEPNNELLNLSNDKKDAEKFTQNIDFLYNSFKMKNESPGKSKRKRGSEEVI